MLDVVPILSRISVHTIPFVRYVFVYVRKVTVYTSSEECEGFRF